MFQEATSEPGCSDRMANHYIKGYKLFNTNPGLHVMTKLVGRYSTSRETYVTQVTDSGSDGIEEGLAEKAGSVGKGIIAIREAEEEIDSALWSEQILRKVQYSHHTKNSVLPLTTPRVSPRPLGEGQG